MRSWDLLTSICKERLHTQVSSTQLHRNSSARLLFPPQSSQPPFPQLLGPPFQARFTCLSPPTLSLVYSPSFSFPCAQPPFLHFLPTFLPSLPSWPGCGWADRLHPSPPICRLELQGAHYGIISRFSKAPRILGCLGRRCRAGGRPKTQWLCCGLWTHAARVQTPALPRASNPAPLDLGSFMRRKSTMPSILLGC